MEGKTSMTGRRLAPPPRLSTMSFRSGPPPTFIAMPLSEKDDLPSIVVTPSSPGPETEFQVDYYSPEQEKQGFFSSVSALRPFGLRPSSRHSTAWFSAKQIKTILLVLLPVLIFIHLFLAPDVENELYDLISSARTSHPHATGMHLLHSASASDEHLSWADSPVIAGEEPVDFGLEDIPVATPVIVASVTKYEEIANLPTPESSAGQAKPAAVEYGASTEL